MRVRLGRSLPQGSGSTLLPKLGLILPLALLLPVPGTWRLPCPDAARFVAVSSAYASEIAPRDSLLAARVYQARLRAESGKLEEAESALRSVLRDSPGYDYAVYELSVVLSWRGKFDESLQLLEQLLRQQPANSGLNAEIGRVLLWKANSTGKREYFKEAISALNARMQVAPVDCNAMKLRAAAHLGLHRFGEAESDLRTCLMLNRQDAEAQRLLAQVLHATGRDRGAPSTPEAYGQSVSPSVRLEGVSSTAKVGLDHRLFRLESWHTVPKIGKLDYQYARWEFTETGLSPVRLSHFALYCEHPLTRWVSARGGVGYGSFTGSDDSGGRMGWSAGLGFRPSVVFLLEGSYSEGHLLESYATLTPDYRVREASGRMMIGRDGGSELNLYASQARHRGMYALGYWNDFHQRWFTLDTLRDDSSRWRLGGFFRQWLCNRPQISFLLSESYFESQRGELLPYWSPALFSEERLILIVSNIDVGPISFGFSGGGSHVREGAHWGYNGAISLVVSLSTSIRIGAEVTYDNVATTAEWTGERARVFAGWR